MTSMADHADLLPALENVASILLKRCHEAATVKGKAVDRLSEDEFYDVVIGSGLIGQHSMHYLPLLRSLMLLEIHKNPSLLNAGSDSHNYRTKAQQQQHHQQQLMHQQQLQAQQRHGVLTRSQTAQQQQQHVPMVIDSMSDSKTDSDDSCGSDCFSLVTRRQDDLEDERKWLNIQRLPSGMYRVSDRLYFDTRTYAGFNFVGRMLGHGGCTIKRLEKLTLCRMQIRGRGSIRNPADEARLRKETGHEHLKEDLHIIFEAEDIEEASAVVRVKNCRQFLVPYMQPTSEESLSLKAEQEREALNGKLKQLAGTSQLTKSTESLTSTGSSNQSSNGSKQQIPMSLHADAKPFQPSTSVASTASTSMADSINNADLLVQQRLIYQNHLLSQQLLQQQQQLQQQPQTISSRSNNQFSQQQQQNMMLHQGTNNRSTDCPLSVARSLDMSTPPTSSSSAASARRSMLGAHGRLASSMDETVVPLSSRSQNLQQHYDLRRRSSVPIPCTTPQRSSMTSLFTAHVDEEMIMSNYTETSDYGSCSDGSGTPTGIDDVFHRNCVFACDKENRKAMRSKSAPTFARTPGAGRKGNNRFFKTRYRSSPVPSPRNNLLMPEGKLPGWSPLDGFANPLRLLREQETICESPQATPCQHGCRRRSQRLSARGVLPMYAEYQ